MPLTGKQDKEKLPSQTVAGQAKPAVFLSFGGYMIMKNAVFLCQGIFIHFSH
jgi:hypothetical protein